MKEIVWLTPEEVASESTTARKALEILIKHWWQNATATQEQQKSNPFWPCQADLCGLCRYHAWSCGPCILPKKGARICTSPNSLYRQARNAWDEYKVEKTQAAFANWLKVARAMHRYLCSLRKVK